VQSSMQLGKCKRKAKVGRCGKSFILRSLNISAGNWLFAE